MDTEVLKDVGLCETEIKIYVSLLKLGQSTTTGIIKDAKIHASKVYEFLDRLIQKGLVSYAIKSNKRFFRAENPKALSGLINEQKKELIEKQEKVNQLIPQLLSLQTTDQHIDSATYEGLSGLKTIYEKIISEGKTQYIIGAPRIGNELLEGFLLEWHKKRIKNKIKCKYIYDVNVKDYGSIREKMPYTEVKYLKSTSPMWIEIFSTYVMIAHIKDHNAVAFLINDLELAKGYLDYFKLIWKQASI